MSKENYMEEIRAHDSAYKHVSGYAEYTDDINEPKNTIFGAIGLSKKAHAIIKKIDLTEVKKSEGVISVVTQSDIPGRNDVGPVFDGDPIFPTNKVEFEEYFIVHTLGSHKKPTWEELETQLVDMQAEYDSREYARKRKAEYDQLNQFEMMFDDQKDGTTTWLDKINEIKAKHPKE